MRKEVGDEEKALGLVHIKKTPGMKVRNWLTYKMRHCILEFERQAYHTPGSVSMQIFKAKFNQSVHFDIKQLIIRYEGDNNLAKLDNLLANEGVLCRKQDGEYILNPIFG